jgi:hypothetical protein
MWPYNNPELSLQDHLLNNSRFLKKVVKITYSRLHSYKKYSTKMLHVAVECCRMDVIL